MALVYVSLMTDKGRVAIFQKMFPDTIPIVPGVTEILVDYGVSHLSVNVEKMVIVSSKGKPPSYHYFASHDCFLTVPVTIDILTADGWTKYQ